MITERDERIIEYIKQFKCVSSKHIQDVFKISRNVANRRLLQLSNNKIKKQRMNKSLEYIYYLPKEKPTEHKLLISEFYSKLIKSSDKIIKFEPEYLINNIRADAFSICVKNGYKYYFCLEVQINHDRPNIKKYEDLLEHHLSLDVFPRIIVITNQKWEYQGKLTVIKLNTGLKEFDKIFNNKNSTG